MKNVQYDGDDTRVIPLTGDVVSKGDVISVPDDFNVFNFSDTKAKVSKATQDVPAVEAVVEAPVKTDGTETAN